jgi:toxin ParE1/3/4
MLLTEARFLKPAQLEFDQAADWYDLQQPGLGVAFADCVEATLLRAMHFPQSGAPIEHPRLSRVVSRFQLDAPFPYDIVATVLHSELFVIAVAHHKREPAYWIARMAKVQR